MHQKGTWTHELHKTGQMTKSLQQMNKYSTSIIITAIGKRGHHSQTCVFVQIISCIYIKPMNCMVHGNKQCNTCFFFGDFKIVSERFCNFLLHCRYIGNILHVNVSRVCPELYYFNQPLHWMKSPVWKQLRAQSLNQKCDLKIKLHVRIVQLTRKFF